MGWIDDMSNMNQIEDLDQLQCLYISAELTSLK